VKHFIGKGINLKNFNTVHVLLQSREVDGMKIS